MDRQEKRSQSNNRPSPWQQVIGSGFAYIFSCWFCQLYSNVLHHTVHKTQHAHGVFPCATDVYTCSPVRIPMHVQSMSGVFDKWVTILPRGRDHVADNATWRQKRKARAFSFFSIFGQRRPRTTTPTSKVPPQASPAACAPDDPRRGPMRTATERKLAEIGASRRTPAARKSDRGGATRRSARP